MSLRGAFFATKHPQAVKLADKREIALPKKRLAMIWLSSYFVPLL
jgi:hypothetical protein